MQSKIESVILSDKEDGEWESSAVAFLHLATFQSAAAGWSAATAGTAVIPSAHILPENEMPQDERPQGFKASLVRTFHVISSCFGPSSHRARITSTCSIDATGTPLLHRTPSPAKDSGKHGGGLIPGACLPRFHPPVAGRLKPDENRKWRKGV